MINTVLPVFLALAAILILITVGLVIPHLHREIQDLRVERDEANLRVYKSDRASERLVIAMTPLIEKSDWMTGRWHGKFQTLVQLETDRNRKVDAAREIIMDEFPVVQDFAKDATSQFLQGPLQ